jgi:hypothetical protein
VHCDLDNLLVIWHAAVADFQIFQKKKRKTSATFCQCEIDANLIWVVMKCWDTGGLASLYCVTLANGHTIRSDKRVYEKRLLGIGDP